MKRTFATFLACLSLTIVVANAIAEDPAPTTAPAASATAGGAVSGIVMKDGKAVEGMQVRLLLPGRPQPATAPSTNAGAAPAANARSGRRQIVAEATTDANGKFTLSDVPPGS